MVKRKIVSLEGATVGLDLGTRRIKVNMTKIRKDETIIPGKRNLQDEQEPLQKEQGGSSSDSKKKVSFTPTPKPAGKTTPKPAAPRLQRTCSWKI